MPMEVLPGPSGYIPTPAAFEGVELPPPGKALLYGKIVDEETAMREAAKAMLTRRNPTIFPGPLVLWGWNASAMEKAKAILELVFDIYYPL